MTHLRMTGGDCWFTNAPLPDSVFQAVKGLAFLDLAFRNESIPGFFRHLPLNDIPEVVIVGPDEDSVYAALDPLRSPFHMMVNPLFQAGELEPEFTVTMRGCRPRFFRHFSEPFADYYPGSDKTNPLFENDEFAAQLADFTLHTVLWSLVTPWLPSFTSLPKLIVIIDEYSPDAVPLPSEALPCPNLDTLVLQARHDFIYIEAEDLLGFVGRITPRVVSLELRRVLIKDPGDMVCARFEPLAYYDQRLN